MLYRKCETITWQSRSIWKGNFLDLSSKLCSSYDVKSRRKITSWKCIHEPSLVIERNALPKQYTIISTLMNGSMSSTIPKTGSSLLHQHTYRQRIFIQPAKQYILTYTQHTHTDSQLHMLLHTGETYNHELHQSAPRLTSFNIHARRQRRRLSPQSTQNNLCPRPWAQPVLLYSQT